MALCKNVTVAATNSCGVSASIDNGSSDPDGDLVGCTQSPAGPYAIGSRTVTLTCTDQGNRSSSCSGTVTVVDQVLPIVTVSPQVQTIQCVKGGTYSYLTGVTAQDQCDGMLPSANISWTGSVNMAQLATTTVTYQAKDSVNNLSVPVARTVTVVDTLPPTFSLLGLPTMAVECGTSFNDPGAQAIDVCVGPLMSAIVKTGSVNVGAVGSYTLRYNVTDGHNAAPTLTRTVNVTDTRKPTVTLLGSLSQTVECGAVYVDPGATATDLCAGTFPAVAGAPPNMHQPGTYTVQYLATDPSGNTGSSPQNRVVTVADTLPSQVTLNGSATMALECATPFTDPGATASDQCAGNLPVTLSGTVNPMALGTQLLTYSANDGRFMATKTRSVTVSDTLPPVLTLAGPASQTLECGTPYVDPGATASDACAGDLSSAIVTSGGVTTTVPGTYTVSYSVTDPSGSSASASRTVSVHDTQAPELQVLPGPSEIECNGTPYVDPGATASDACAGDLTSSITASSNLDQTHSGDYTISYRVQDASGNVSTATRSLTVGPCVSCFPIQLSEYNLFLEQDYTGGHDVEGKVAAGGHISMTDFSVGGALPANQTARTLVAGGNLTLSRGGVWGDAWYGGSYSADSTVVYPRGTVAQGTPIDFAARFAELRALSSRLGHLTVNGGTTRTPWGGIYLQGTDASLNVFDVNASAFTGAALLNVQAPAGSLAVVNIHGASASFSGFGIFFSGGIDQHGVLYNFVDATSITASGFGFWGTVLAPNAHVDFSNGSWDGGLYARSLTGNAEGHINPLTDRQVCQ